MMNEEILPEIPAEQTPSTNSMYEQLRRTSQKWFQKSHKRIFDNSSHQRSTHSAHLNSQITSQFSPRAQTSPNKVRLMELMREQIDIVCQQYAIKTKNMLQEQAKKIKMLSQLLAKNQQELEAKNKTIAMLDQSLRNIRNSRNDQDTKGIQGRLQMVERKLKQMEDAIRRNNGEQKLEEIRKSLRISIQTIGQNYINRLDEIQFDLEDRMDRIDKMSHINHTMNHSIRSPRPNCDNNQTEQRIETLENQLQELRYQIESFQNKKYTYENYKLEEVQNKINKIYAAVNRLEVNKQKSKQELSQIKLKSSQTTQLTSTATLPNQSKSKFFNRYKSLINNRKMREETYTSEQSQAESQVEETIVEDQENNIDRFIRVVTESRMNLPVHIEIDSTGYVRSVDTGMYLVDSTSNGFEFTASELHQLRLKRIVQI